MRVFPSYVIKCQLLLKGKLEILYDQVRMDKETYKRYYHIQQRNNLLL